MSMSQQRKPRPRDFPILFSRAQARKVGRAHWPGCRVCRLSVEPRNRRRHEKACARRKRLAPRMWAEWKYDMNHPGNDDNPYREDADELA